MNVVARKWAGAAAVVPFVLLLGYFLAGAIGGALPANSDWREAEAGIRVFVESNGVHTGIVVPKVAAGEGWRVDWRPLIRAEHLADPRYAGHDHLSFGWGERAFYLETPSWSDLRPGTVLAAAFGSDRTLVHVDHVPMPRETSSVRAVVLRPDEYRRLTGFLRASFGDPARHRHGYAGFDAFYDGRGHYSAVRTCNAWTGAALHHAGVRVGRWTPFPETVMQWFR